MTIQTLPVLEGLCTPQRAAIFTIIYQWVCWHCPDARFCSQGTLAAKCFVLLRQWEGRKDRLEKAINSKEAFKKKVKKQEYLE